MSSTGFLSTAHAVAGLGDDFVALSDPALLRAQTTIAEHRRQLDLLSARCAGEIDRRSSHELGYSGLARREGFVNTEALLQSLTGSSKTDVSKLVRVGSLLASGGASPVTGEVGWQGAVVTAIESGELSVDAANSISIGLGALESIDAASVVTAAEELVKRADTTPVDQLMREARAERDRLDEEAIAARQKERHDQRYFWAKRQPSGMVTGSFALADEDGAFLLAVYDRAVGPRPVGPRFEPVVDNPLPSPDEPRTRGQKAADEFIGLLRVGVDADPHAVLGADRPAVRVLVTESTFARREGHGRIEASPDPVSFETIERHLCTEGMVGVKFDSDGQVVNVGREQRLFTRRQRVGMAARDGGCRIPSCDRPVSWTEAHHIEYWKDDGKTDIADGICLCRLHHLLIHNNHWRIERDGGTYWLIPPPDIDPLQRRILMPSKQPLVAELMQVG